MKLNVTIVIGQCCGRNIYLIPFLIVNRYGYFPFCGRKENQIPFHRIILFDFENDTYTTEHSLL